MILAIDVGNTNIVLGGIDEDKIHFTARLSTDRFKTGDEYAVLMKNLLELNGKKASDMEGGIISTVVPALAAPLRNAVEKITGKCCMVVGSGLKTGLNILIDNPAQLGSDLVVDAVAAIAQYPKPIMVFDLGTATTLSVINKSGGYIGGMIMPGVVLGMEALSNRTSQLPHIGLEPPKKLVGSNTIDCMKSGTLYGNAAMLDGIVERVAEQLGEEPTVIATGGLARVIVPNCRKKIICDDNLMLKGLMILYKKNQKNAEK